MARKKYSRELRLMVAKEAEMGHLIFDDRLEIQKLLTQGKNFTEIAEITSPKFTDFSSCNSGIFMK